MTYSLNAGVALLHSSIAGGALLEKRGSAVVLSERLGAIAAQLGESDRGPAVSAQAREVVSRPGFSLPDATRTDMESRFGYDFRDVRIHADEPADRAARAVQARAFTRREHIVFARGQYAPHSPAGRWLLAHELTHVAQQGKARETGAAPAIASDPEGTTLRRVKWGTAVDAGRDSYPWGSGPRGDVYLVETDAGTRIRAWKPHDGSTYWCHGFTFGGSTASGGPFSIWGDSVMQVIADDGWKPAFSCVAQRGETLVFADNNVAHSGLVASAFEPGGIIDENRSMLDSKWGQLPQNVSSWATNAGQYRRYKVYSKNPAFGPCAGKGPNEG